MKNDSPSSSCASSSSDDDSDREWTKKQRGNEQPTNKEYTYKRLADLKAGDKKQNVICVVKEFQPPAPTRGSDYYNLLTLIDESNPRVGIRAIFFNKNTDKFPRVKRVGDIICIHRINVNNFNYRTQLEGGGYCSIIRFSGEVSKKIKPCTGSVTYSLSSVERERVRKLRKWSRKQRMESQLCTLQSVHPDIYFDLVCQVVCVTISKLPHCMVLSVWDGTPHSLQCRNISLEKNYDEGYPEVREDSELSESSRGYSVNIVVYSKQCMKKISNLQPGKILYVQNLLCAMVDRDTIEMCVYPKNDACYHSMTSKGGETSRITILNRRDELCRIVENQIEKANTPITATPHSAQPFCTVSDITSYDPTFPTKFHCRTRVLGVNASCLEDVVITHCSLCQHNQAVSRHMTMNTEGTCSQPCSKCSPKGRDRSSKLPPPSLPFCQFYFEMILGDSSGEVAVKVGNEQAVELFGGLSPNNLYQYQQLRFQISDLLYAMTGGSNPFALGGGGGNASSDGGGGVISGSVGNGGGAVSGASGDVSGASACADGHVERHGFWPWLDCCVLAVKDHATTHYCLFDTILKQT